MKKTPTESSIDVSGRGGIPLDLLEAAKATIAEALASNLSITPISRIQKTINRPNKKGSGDLAFPIATIQEAKGFATPEETVDAIAQVLDELLQDSSSQLSQCVESYAQPTPSHIGITLKVSYTAQILQAITHHGYLPKLSLPEADQHHVMIEYSQPNTHKAFHVGHMRNVALGDCLVRLKEHCGHSVIAANYFGDEGAHVAKCLWRLEQVMKQKSITELDALDVPIHERTRLRHGAPSQPQA